MKKMILDLDTGVDDALAISYALGSPEIELIGITGTYGNVLVEQGVRNALAVTDLLGHPEVKVYQGLPHSSTTDHFEVLPISAFIHGDNGIGDVEIPDSSRSVETESAVDFIIDAVKTYGKDLVYVPTGPMTNIEAALKKAPEIKDEIGQIVLMGGALTVPGNCNACMEANISQDPEAADYLFRSGAPTTMIGLDVTLQTLLTYKETQQWRDLGTKAGKFLADMTDFYIKAYETTSPHLGGCGFILGVEVCPCRAVPCAVHVGRGHSRINQKTGGFDPALAHSFPEPCFVDRLAEIICKPVTVHPGCSPELVQCAPRR